MGQNVAKQGLLIRFQRAVQSNIWFLFFCVLVSETFLAMPRFQDNNKGIFINNSTSEVNSARKRFISSKDNQFLEDVNVFQAMN